MGKRFEAINSVVDWMRPVRRLAAAIEVARRDARQICQVDGNTSKACAVAWEVVEELQAEDAHQRNT